MWYFLPSALALLHLLSVLIKKKMNNKILNDGFRWFKSISVHHEVWFTYHRRTKASFMFQLVGGEKFRARKTGWNKSPDGSRSIQKCIAKGWILLWDSNFISINLNCIRLWNINFRCACTWFDFGIIYYFCFNQFIAILIHPTHKIQERLRKEEESEPKFLAARRKSTKDIAAVQERNLEKFATRRRNLKAISNSPSLHVSG